MNIVFVPEAKDKFLDAIARDRPCEVPLTGFFGDIQP